MKFPTRPILVLAVLLSASCSLSSPGRKPNPQTRPRSVPGNPEAIKRQIQRAQEQMRVDHHGGHATKTLHEWKPIDQSAPEYHAVKYRISLTFPENGGERFDGQLQLTLQPLNDGFQLVSLDSSELDIRSVKLLNTFETLRFESRPEEERVLVDLGRAYSTTDTLTLLIEYGWAKDPNRGIYFRSRDGVAGNETIYSQSESEEAKYWFPGNSRPNDRSLFESFITIPKPEVALSNGALVDVTEHGGSRTYHWSLATPMVSYLFVLTAGKFAIHEERWRGIGVQYYGYPDDMERVTFSLRNTPDILSFLSDRIGFQYPYEKYAQSVVPQYPWGGMEHVTATTLTDETVHGPAEDSEYSSDGLVAHEMGHQWFGDLATSRNWDQLWLNEGFATYMDLLWTEHVHGEVAYLRDLEDGAAWYFDEEDLDARPVVFPYFHVNLDDFFDSRNYAKGSWVLHMLRNLVGDDAFFRGIRTYIHRRQNTLVTTAEFKTAMEEESGRDLGWFFEQWLERPGYPKFDVSWTIADGKLELTVRQTQDTSLPGGVAGTVPYFKGPVAIELGGVAEKVWLAGKAEETFTFPILLGAPPAWVKFNSHNGILSRVSMTQPFEAWHSQLTRSEDPAARVEAAQWMGTLPEVSIDMEAEQLARTHVLSSCAGQDAEPWVRAACVDGLARIADPELNPVASQNVLDAIFASSVLATTETDSFVRESVASLLGHFPPKRSLPILKGMILSGKGLKPQLAAIRALGSFEETDDAYDLLTSLLPRQSFQDLVPGAALAALGELGDVRAFDFGLEYAREGHSKATREGAFALLASMGYAQGGEYSQQARAVLEGALSNRASPPRMAAVKALGTLKNPETVAALTRVLESDPEMAIRIAARAAIDAIEESRQTRR